MTTGVVITGAGLVCGLGGDREASWRAILAQHCPLGPYTALEQQMDPPVHGGEASGLDDPVTGQHREVAGLHAALAEALAESGFSSDDYCSDRVGVVLGTTLAGMRSCGRFFRSKRSSDLGSFLAASALEQLMEDRDWHGPAITTTSACGSGLASICLGVSLLKAGVLDVVVTGGYDPISEYAWAGFNSLRLISEHPPRPFAETRDGMQLGESYAVLVLERAPAVEQRGGSVLARIAGYGESSDAHHLTQPHPEGIGAAAAMGTALHMAQVEPASIGLVSAHATATPNNDAAERAALRDVFGAALGDTPVVGFKSYLGHTLGGAGATELILTSMAMRDGLVPRTLHVAREDLAFDDIALNLGENRPALISHTLGTSLGFGGANSCVVLSAPSEQADTEEPGTPKQVVVTGVGVVFPGAIGNEAFSDALRSGAALQGGPIDEALLLGQIDARRTRRMSMFVKLTLAAATMAMRDAGIEDSQAWAEEAGALLGSTHCSAEFTEAYYGQIVGEGMQAANPSLFAEGVPNVGTAQLCLALGLRGSAQTIIGSRTAGLDALQLAAARIANGEWSRAVVGAADEHSALIEQAYRDCNRGSHSGAGAVILILESVECAEGRGANVRAHYERGVMRFASGETSVAPLQAHLGAAASQLAVYGFSDAPASTLVDSLFAEAYSASPLGAVAAGLLVPQSLVGNADATFGVAAQGQYGSQSGVLFAPATGTG